MVRPLGVVLCIVLSTAAHAEVPTDPLGASLKAKVERSLDEVDQRFDGVLGIGILDLTSGETILREGDTEFPIASSIKIPILAAVLQSDKVNLVDTYTLAATDIVGGDGSLQHLTAGST